MSFQQAARELRVYLNLSQQSMATVLGLSMGALRNYESSRVINPDPRAAAAYLIVAKNARLLELHKVVYFSLQDALGYPLWSLARPPRPHRFR
jgi:transcriptional regulator with XRE-family HTH domain